MVTIEKDKLIITMEDPEPTELLKNLQQAIVETLQAQFSNEEVLEAGFSTYVLLELLKQLLKKPIFNNQQQ